MNDSFDPASAIVGPDVDHGGNFASLPPQRRHRKAIIESDPEDEEPPLEPKAKSSNHLSAATAETGNSGTPTYSMDTDISTLQAPTFTTLDRGPSQAMTQLRWDHQVHPIGKKVDNPMIHVCDKCMKPILSYGRMIPCKHVFCFSCAKKYEAAAANPESPKKTGSCGRCRDKVIRVEQAGLGSIFMCYQGGSRYGNNGCRRTYLSQRDLQAHINHRHKSAATSSSSSTATVNSTSNVSNPPPPAATLPSAADIQAATAAIVASQKSAASFPGTGSDYPPPRGHYANKNPSYVGVINNSRQSNSNLITVPLQQEFSTTQQKQQPPSAVAASTPIHQPPPNFFASQPPPGLPQSQAPQQQQWRTSSGYRR